MPDRPNTEALARALGCDPYDMPTRPLSVDGVTIGGGIERRCGTHGRAMSRCRIAKVAEHILADPGPLLEALTEAGVLREERAALRPCGCRRPEGDISGCCLGLQPAQVVDAGGDGMRLVRVVRTPRLCNGDFSENLSTGDVVRVIGTDEDGDLVVERLGWDDYLSVSPEYVEDVDAYPMACGRCWGVHPVGACDRWPPTSTKGPA